MGDMCEHLVPESLAYQHVLARAVLLCVPRPATDSRSLCAIGLPGELPRLHIHEAEATAASCAEHVALSLASGGYSTRRLARLSKNCKQD